MSCLQIFGGLEIWNEVSLIDRLMTDDIYHFDYELWRTQSTKITLTYFQFYIGMVMILWKKYHTYNPI